MIPLFLLLLTPLAADIPDTSSLSSAQASYDGNSLLLTGHVCLDHGLGKMTAEEASLQRQEAGRDFPFSLIQLRKDVLLSLKNSARIACGSADLDFDALTGTLLPAENGKVVYTDAIRKKKGDQPAAFTLSGNSVQLHFSKHATETNKTEYDIDHILSQEDVVIDYADGFQLLAHRALYRKELPSDNKTAKREFQGTVTAYPKDEQSFCKLLHEGDEVLAEMIDIDLIHAKISLVHPKGTLAASFVPHVQKAPLQFQSDYLYWDQNRNALTLKGNISLEESSLGTLHAQDELQLVQAIVRGKRQIKTIDAQGDSTLHYKDGHKLIAHGPIHLDRDQLKATVDSPKKEGLVPLEKQLYYEEEEIAFYADSATVEYSLTEETMQPSSLTLKGNIRLFSHDPQKPPRFGVADRLTYSPATRTLILSANPGKKVLFWDETQSMHLSAPEVHIFHDPETQQQIVKGIGAVQFSFTPEEQNFLQQLFPQLKSLP